MTTSQKQYQKETRREKRKRLETENNADSVGPGFAFLWLVDLYGIYRPDSWFEPVHG